MNLSSIPTGAVVLLCLLCCVARLWEANDDAGGPLIRLDEPALRRQLVPFPNHPSRRYLQVQEAYMVEVHLALYYVTEDIALAMESKDPTNPVVAHFCKNFNQQASGPQVVEAASEAGDVYETRILETANDAPQDYDCQVIQSNRVIFNDTIYNIPDDQFILEVFVHQIVFVISDRTVSNDEVYTTVAQGFNRGTGGRVRFLTLLKLMDDFSTLLDFEVLEGGFSIPQNLPTVPSRSPSPSLATSSPPSQAPSYAPTMTPSSEPSSSPSSSPSLSPSTVPESSSPVASSMSPTRAPSLAPSRKPEITLDPTTMPPTAQPTVLGAGAINQPTQQPSKFPTNSGQDSQTAPAETSSTNDRRGLILGAIAGGVATIFVSCFFIFCVWFPLCGKPRSGRSVASERRRQQGSVSSSQSDGAEAAAAMIPGVVNLVDENASLADTTLGDQTMGLLPPKKIKRLGDTDNLRMLDSFDDNSLYTSSVAPTSALGGSSEPSEPSDQSFYSQGNSMLLPPSLDNTLDYEQDIIFPTSRSASDSGGDGEEIELRRIGYVEVDEEEIQVVTVLDDSDQSDVVSYGKPDDGSVDPAKESEDYKSEIESEIDREGFNPFDAIPAAESDEEKARDFSQNMDRGDYDPFAEDTSGTSSFGFDNIEPLDVNSANPYGPPQEIPDDRSSPSSSSQTKRIENLILGSFSHSSDMQERLGATSEQVENRDVDESKGVKDRKASNDSDRSPPHDFFSNYEEANNTLLRSVLEDARLLAESKSPSLPSRTSRKSAPPRMLKPAGSGHTKPKATNATMADLEDGKEAAKPGKARGTSSMSVGGEPRPRDPRDKGEPAPKPPTRPTQNARSRGDVSYGTEDVGDIQDDVAGPSDFFPPYRTRFLDRVAVMKPHHFLPTGSGGRSGSTPTAPSRLKNKTEMKLPESPKPSPSPEQVEVTSVASETSSIPSSAGGSANGKLGAQPRSYYGETWSATSDDSVMHQASESEESSLFTPESSPGVLGIASQPDEDGRKMLDDGASSNSDDSSNHWLFDAVEQTLGPRSPAVDMNSLSGRSTRSERSHKSTRSNRSRKSHQSEKKSSSRNKFDHSPSQKDVPFNPINKPSSIVVSLPSGIRVDEHKNESDEASITPRTLEHDLKRLQMQLADVLQTEMDQITTSSIAASSATGSAYSAKRRAAAKKSNKNHVVLVVPPGKLGVVLANRHDGKGTVVAEVRPHSSMRGVLSPGDRLVAVDGKDVTNMIVGDVTKLMASRSNAERRLTVITSAPPSGRDMDEAKVQEHA